MQLDNVLDLIRTGKSDELVAVSDKIKAKLDALSVQAENIKSYLKEKSFDLWSPFDVNLYLTYLTKFYPAETAILLEQRVTGTDLMEKSLGELLKWGLTHSKAMFLKKIAKKWIDDNPQDSNVEFIQPMI